MPFVHTASRSYRLDDAVKILDRAGLAWRLVRLLAAGSCLNLII